MRSGDNSSDQTPDARPPKSKLEAASATPRPGDRDMGVALRKVYQHTVEEAIPAEMLDLLGKLD